MSVSFVILRMKIAVYRQKRRQSINTISGSIKEVLKVRAEGRVVL